ncbi:conserved protein of unknown function [Ruminococcaceae bacterium BL-6]|nr:conserved protein of unknown function [Ruminococcaceae bacterium BL-6]
MLDKDDLQAIAELLKPIYAELGSLKGQVGRVENRLDSLDDRMGRVENRLDKMQGDIDILKESSEITRSATNRLLDWAEDASIQTYPLYKKHN